MGITTTDLSLRFLEDITNKFSEDRKIGSGGYGEVYKGVDDKSGEVMAVKKLYPSEGIDDEQFNNEFNNLMRIRHPNIVRLLGYCYDIQHKHIKHNDGFVFSKVITRILCFEYLQHGSLENHLSDESCGLDWRTRYKIIRGICEGLNYLHGLEEPIFHLDLKPGNILLDENMLPKIADFGLSRLFGGTQTHVTRTVKGTFDYMPPEYIKMRQISKKYDIFSLGIVIIVIITGPEGFKRCADMPSKQFVEHVRNNWWNRIKEESEYAKEYCQQVKRCTEIALNCVEVEKHKRPTIVDIIHELKKTETAVIQETVEEDMAGFIKFGAWGGKGGRAHEMKVAPRRLKSVTIYSGVIVDSLTFSYTDRNGHQQTVGPWGGPGGSAYTIQFGQSEFLQEISGTIGPFMNLRTNVVTSLKFVTNKYIHGPFGQGGGTEFCAPTKSTDNIVGFFGHAGWYLDAIGVYLHPKQPTFDGEESTTHVQTTGGRGEEMGMARFNKIGPWGGNGGIDHDMEVVPHRLESITIYSSVVVDSLEFSYSEVNGKKHALGPWGTISESSQTIRLGNYEFLMTVSGTVGPFNTMPNVITSLKFVTNGDTYGPFGQGGGTPFDVPMQNNGNIVGFFGRAGLCLEALGVYIRTF